MKTAWDKIKFAFMSGDDEQLTVILIISIMIGALGYLFFG